MWECNGYIDVEFLEQPETAVVFASQHLADFGKGAELYKPEVDEPIVVSASVTLSLVISRAVVALRDSRSHKV